MKAETIKFPNIRGFDLKAKLQKVSVDAGEPSQSPLQAASQQDKVLSSSSKSLRVLELIPKKDPRENTAQKMNRKTASSKAQPNSFLDPSSISVRKFNLEVCDDTSASPNNLNLLTRSFLNKRREIKRLCLPIFSRQVLECLTQSETCQV